MSFASIPCYDLDLPAPRYDTLRDWLRWQESLHFTAIEMGLERCGKVAKNLGLLNPNFTVVSVAGTNGKGSSVAMLDLIFRHAEYKTGSYTSPHLVRYNERIKLNGVEVSDAMLCESFERLDQARGNISLTYFEFGTLAALDIFHRADIDVALLEVGLGGRLDAVNCVDADVALISSIDLDHMQWLGHDRETIAYEKAGIFRPGQAAVCSDPHPPRTVLTQAKTLGAHLYIPARDYHYRLFDDHWSWQWDTVNYENLPSPDHYNRCQIQNAAGVLMVLQALHAQLPTTVKAVENGFRDFKLSGRFQVLTEATQTILDVAHNVQAARMLAHNLRQFPISGTTHMVVGMLKDKDQKGVLKALLDVTDRWHMVSTAGTRGSDSTVLKDELLALGAAQPIVEYETVAEALTKLKRETGKHDRIVVSGSFLSVGDAMQYLEVS